jgi:N-acetylmuramoyl-L-alanine amidase
MARRRSTDYIVIHCSDTYETMDIDAATIRRWHVEERGWSDIGYHKVILRDGTIEQGRPDTDSGAHAKNYNSKSIAVCMVGGRNDDDQAEDNFTDAQWQSLQEIVIDLRTRWPNATVLGHRDLDGVTKECPSFDVASKLSQWDTSRW